ncbi:MAG: ABC transporter ATP-binding protein [Flavobacteriales bacterium]|nr:ABC transporter ATP-binding protein [Flavobacteriales bacterium]|tara:strand:- start:9168 stop:9863 length:696 start_codon:yes stop_codon:yes gene_type:complete
MSVALEVSDLRKRYGKKLAVNNISFQVERGSVFGLLGPNGSGKTTTISMILTLIKPDGGNIRLFGNSDLTEELKRTGVLLESATYYPNLSAARNLKISCKIKGVSEESIDKALEKVGLLTEKNNKVKNFSLGMKQRLNVASALLSEPDFLIFDEPTNGLDPQGIADMRKLLIELGQSGKTILIASHLLNEMEKICQHVAIMKEGRILDQGEIKSLTQGFENLEEYFLNITS